MPETTEGIELEPCSLHDATRIKVNGRLFGPGEYQKAGSARGRTDAVSLRYALDGWTTLIDQAEFELFGIVPMREKKEPTVIVGPKIVRLGAEGDHIGGFVFLPSELTGKDVWISTRKPLTFEGE